MARFFPPEPLNSHASEKAVWNALTHLPDDWRVFHSVAWQSVRRGRQGDGEADFVLLHKSFGLLILEVKGGSEIGVQEGRWYSVNSRTGERNNIKNPFDQATASKHALLRYFEGLDPLLHRIPIGHAVVFPGATHSAAIGPYGPRDLVIDASDLLHMPEAIARAIDHWEHRTQVPQELVDVITRGLAPTTTIRRRLSTDVESTNAELLTLTEQQKTAFRITRTRRKAAVSGGPGTGKTVLALEKALQLADGELRILLTCFNRPLADELQRVCDSRVTVRTFHSLCMEQMRDAGENPEPRNDERWWLDAAPEGLLRSVEATGAAYDAIIIDEGQDFAPSWIAALRLILADPDEGLFFVFYDPRQALLRPDWELPDDLESFPLDWNCRNTLAIARKVCAVYGDEVLAIGTEGDRANWIKADSTDFALRAAQELVDDLLANEGLRPSQVVVLTDSRPVADRMQQMVVSTASFTPLGGNGVIAETIYRYKGLDADVVIVVLSQELADDELKALAYVGMSRARTLLTVIGPRRAQKAVGWS